MSDLKEQLIRLGQERPDLRKDIRPLLETFGTPTHKEADSSLAYIVPSIHPLAKELDSNAYVNEEGDYGNIVLTLNQRAGWVSYNMRWLGQRSVLDLGTLGFGPRVWAAVLSKPEVRQLTSQSQQDLGSLLKRHRVKVH